MRTINKVKITSWIFALLLAGCTFVVQDTRTPEEKVALTATAEANLVPTVTATAIPPLPSVEPEVVPQEEVGESTPVPPEALIKGNVSSSGEKIYHVPGQANYNNVKIDETKGEAWFVTEEEAVAAGFRKARR